MIYFFRASLSAEGLQSALNGDTPGTVAASLSSLLKIAHRSFDSLIAGIHERLQWPLFMAGIETQDPIHRSWILSHMRQSALLTALKRVYIEEAKTGCRLSMGSIKETLANVDAGGDLTTINRTSAWGSTNSLLDSSSVFEDSGDNNLCLW